MSNKMVPYRKKNKKQPSRVKVYGNAASQLYKDVKMLKNLINTEFKFLDTNYNGTANSTAQVADIGNPAIGDTSTTIDGMQFRLKSVQTDLNMEIVGTSALVRCWWVLDIDAQATLPSFGDILNVPIATRPTLVQRNLSNKRRFIILKDKTFIMNNNGSNQKLHYKYYRKLDAKVEYQTTGTNFSHNRLLFLWTSDVPLANAPSFQAFHRIRFIDN